MAPPSLGFVGMHTVTLRTSKWCPLKSLPTAGGLLEQRPVDPTVPLPWSIVLLRHRSFLKVVFLWRVVESARAVCTMCHSVKPPALLPQLCGGFLLFCWTLFSTLQIHCILCGCLPSSSGAHQTLEEWHFLWWVQVTFFIGYHSKHLKADLIWVFLCLGSEHYHCEKNTWTHLFFIDYSGFYDQSMHDSKHWTGCEGKCKKKNQ